VQTGELADQRGAVRQVIQGVPFLSLSPYPEPRLLDSSTLVPPLHSACGPLVSFVRNPAAVATLPALWMNGVWKFVRRILTLASCFRPQSYPSRTISVLPAYAQHHNRVWRPPPAKQEKKAPAASVAIGTYAIDDIRVQPLK